MSKQKSKLWYSVRFTNSDWPETAPDILAVDRAGRIYLGHCGQRELGEMTDSEFKECTPIESLDWMIRAYESFQSAECDWSLYFAALVIAFKRAELPAQLTTKQQQRKYLAIQ